MASSAEIIGRSRAQREEPSAEELPPTSVVMPTYNRSASLRSVVEPLLADSFATEIIVVVDGSEDGSMELLEQLAKRDERLRPLWIPNSGEMGARGAGAEYACGEVLVILDDDVRASPGLARAHAAWHARGERLVVIGYMPIGPPREHANEHFATYLYSREYERACARYEAAPTLILHHLWAGNMSLRRLDALAIGFPNPAYPARYHQDREFGLRCLRGGMVGVFDRGLRGEHLHSRSLASFRRDARAQGEGEALMRSLHGDLLAADATKGRRSRAVAAALRAAVRLVPYGAASSSLVTALETAHKLRLFALETAAARLLRLVERHHGEVVAASRDAVAAGDRQ